MTSTVTVVVPNWNGLAHVRACFDGLRRQGYKNFVTVAVDNGSTDGSAELIAKEYPEVRLVRLPRNTGFAAAMNRVLAELATPYYAMLNNDTEAEPGWLGALVQALEDDPRYGAATSRMMQFVDREVIDNCGVAVTTIGTAFDIGRGEHAVDKYMTPREVFCACAGAALFRSELLRDVGLFDESFFAGYEDVDLGFRARRLGWRTLYVPNAVVYHKIHATLATIPQHTAYLAQRNVEWVWLKNMPGILMLRYLPIRLLYEFGAIVYFARAGKLRAFLRAKWDVLSSLSETLRARRREQQRSRVSVRELGAMLDRRAVSQRLPKFFGRRAAAVSP